MALPRPIVVAALVLATPLLTGCTEPEDEAFDLEVHSAPTEILSEPVEPAALAAAQPTGEGVGHFAGVVVDPSVRPIEGAVVRLPTLDLHQVTDRDGSFGFVDLAEGPYLVEVNATGYRSASSMVAVKADEFTRAKVVLAPVPPPEPYHVVMEFAGYTELSTNPLVTGQWVCTSCHFSFGVEQEGLRALVLEATFDAPDVGNERGFYVRFGGSTLLCVICSGQPDPMRIELRDEDLPEKTDRLRLETNPQTFPGYETAVHFHVYVTAFYNELPPTGWSFLSGDR